MLRLQPPPTHTIPSRCSAPLVLLSCGRGPTAWSDRGHDPASESSPSMRRAAARAPLPAASRGGSVVHHADGRWRCAWCAADPLYVAYHDTEWGVPTRDDHRLFEMLCLEGAQAGL